MAKRKINEMVDLTGLCVESEKVPELTQAASSPAVAAATSQGDSQKERKMPVIWADDRQWDTGKVRESKIPPNARLYDCDGEWTYLLRRFNTDNGYRYEPLTINKVKTEKDDKGESTSGEISPATLGEATSWGDLGSFFSADPPNYEKLEKGLIIAFIIGGFVFLFLLIVIMLGESGGGAA